MTELTVNGIATEPAQRFWTPLNSWAFTPSWRAIRDALEQIAARGADESYLQAERGTEWIQRCYDWDVLVRDWWAPFLAQVEQDSRG